MFIKMGNPNNTIKAFVTILNFADYLKDKALQEYAINKVKNDFEGNENATTALQEILNEFNMT